MYLVQMKNRKKMFTNQGMQIWTVAHVPGAHNTVLALIDEGIMAGTERGSYN